MSQRTGGYAGGIQAGTSPADSAARALERELRTAASGVGAASSHVAWVPAIPPAVIAARLGVPKGRAVGVSPDGGVFYDATTPGRVLLAAEAKKQGVGGNAIERWFKNWAVLNHLGVEVYLTVCTGEGFFDGNVAQRVLETALALESDGPERLGADQAWNVPRGRLWLYRYRTVPGASELAEVVESALAHAAARPAPAGCPAPG